MKKFDGTVIVVQKTWIIEVDNGGTSGDCSDDIYRVSGGGQYLEAGASSAGILQVVMVGSAMKTSCKYNPVNGWVMIQNLDAGTMKNEIGQIVLTSHSGCDGAMDVTAATGVYIRTWGKIVPLYLDR